MGSNHLAIGLIKKRLSDALSPEIKSTYEVIGEPTDYQGAAALAAEDKYRFQWWALGQVGARPADQKRGADRGIDGRLYFHDDDSGQSKQIVFSVKAGGVSVPQVRDLVGVLAREKADLGVFLCFEEPTKPMLKEAAEAGFYKSSDGTTYPRLQILTIQQILDGRQPQHPLHRRDATFKKAPQSPPAETSPSPASSRRVTPKKYSQTLHAINPETRTIILCTPSPTRFLGSESALTSPFLRPGSATPPTPLPLSLITKELAVCLAER